LIDGYSFMRFCVGAIIVPHGYTKLFQAAASGAAGRQIVGRSYDRQGAMMIT
jgi:hypothetical protein